MTDWQIAGNVGMIGLNFAPALGAAGGAALKKLNGPDFFKLGGCFVAGTAVHLSASPLAVSELELAYAATASDSFSYDLGFAWEESCAESALVVPIEQAPLGSRIATKNPEAFELHPNHVTTLLLVLLTPATVDWHAQTDPCFQVPG